MHTPSTGDMRPMHGSGGLGRAGKHGNGLDRPLRLPHHFRCLRARPAQPHRGDLDHPDPQADRHHHQSGPDHPGVPAHHRPPGADPDAGDRADRDHDRGVLRAHQAQRRLRARGDERGRLRAAPGLSPGDDRLPRGRGLRRLHQRLSRAAAPARDERGGRQGEDRRRRQRRAARRVQLGRARPDLPHPRPRQRDPVPRHLHRRFPQPRGARHHRRRIRPDRPTGRRARSW